MDLKISVIMTVYNNESSIDASIRSIVEQTFQGWEMILVNDASTDGTLNKLLKWQEQDSRVKVLSNAINLGRAASSNLALEKSPGKYIARMDGDDIAMPERFMKQVAFLDENPQYAIVSSSCILFDNEGEWGIRYSKENPQKRDFLWGSQFLHPATTMRREALLSIGGYRVCKDTIRTEDYDLYMRMYAKGYLGYNMREPLLKYFETRKPRRLEYSYRISEAKIRYVRFRELGLMPVGLLYVVKPLLIGLLPCKLKRKLQSFRDNSPEVSNE